jgi:hypothetical protein
MRTSRRFRSHSRRGLTILEVLMAIGVAVVGLFGVWALIPVAGQKAQRAILEDEKSAFGRSAFHDFEVRGMRDPKNWLWQSTGNPAPFAPQATVAKPRPLLGMSYCIDPYLIADRGTAATPSAVPFFPAAPDPPVSPFFMRRVTLRSAQGSTSAMDRQFARRVFETVDDLETSPQDDESLPAAQQFSMVDPNDPTLGASRRLARGDLSWMATVVPANIYPTLQPSPTDSYLLSIVVFNKRDFGATFNEQEAVFDVNPVVPGQGYGGGDITLDATNTELNRNDWVVLAQAFPGPTNAAGNRPPLTRFLWYRVVAVDDDGTATNVTLDGQDWNPNFTTKCIAVRDVVAVYEKTIRLETSSLWK